MSNVISPLHTTAPPPLRPEILVQNKFEIPGWVVDLASFRQWAHSDSYPQTGWVSFLDGKIFVDPDTETILTYNQVKQAFNLGIGMMLLAQPTGRFVPDRML